jgi:hypothetical protein
MTNAPERIWYSPIIARANPVKLAVDDGLLGHLEYIRADLHQPKPTSELITRAEQAAEWARDYPQYINTIRDLITALQAAPTADQLRGWAKRCDAFGLGKTPKAMRAVADRMEGK